MSDKLSYDGEDHEHYMGLRRIYSVTQILSLAGKIDTRWYKSGSAEIGTTIHKQCSDIKEGIFHDSEQAKIEAFKNWIKFSEHDFEIVEMEQPFMSTKFYFCGKIDILAKRSGKYCVIDIKSGAPEKWHETQLGAYAEMIRETYGLKYLPDGYGLYLKTGGKFSFPKKDTAAGFEEFKICLAEVITV